MVTYTVIFVKRTANVWTMICRINHVVRERHDSMITLMVIRKTIMLIR
jgi:hypothetical protein